MVCPLIRTLNRFLKIIQFYPISHTQIASSLIPHLPNANHLIFPERHICAAAHRHDSLLFIHYSFHEKGLLMRILTYWISRRGYQRNVFTFSTVKMLKTRLKVWKTKWVFHTLHAKVVFSWGYMPARQQNIELLPWRCYNKHTVYRPDCPLWLWKTVPDGAENAEFSTNRRAYALDR